MKHALLLIGLLGCIGCAHSRRVYEPTEAFFKGDQFPVPQEFVSGTASLANVDAWVASVLGASGRIEHVWQDIDWDGRPELFVCQSANAGTGGVNGGRKV